MRTIEDRLIFIESMVLFLCLTTIGKTLEGFAFDFYSIAIFKTMRSKLKDERT